MPVTRPGLASVLLRHLLSTNFTDAPILPRETISEDGLELKQGVILRRAGVLYASIYAMSTFEPLAVRKTGSLNGRVPVFSRVVLLGLHYLVPSPPPPLGCGPSLVYPGVRIPGVTAVCPPPGKNPGSWPFPGFSRVVLWG